MLLSPSADAETLTHAGIDAASAVTRIVLKMQENIGPELSMCVPLETSSDAQSLDNVPSDEESA
jgi:hypothetical protein